MVGFSSTYSGSWLLKLATPQILLLAASSLGLAACSEARAPSSGEQLALGENAQIEEIEAEQLDRLLNDKKIHLIDVRTDAEVAEGMIPGAEHIELDKFDPAKLDLSDGREPVLYCRSGKRSQIAAERLSKQTGKKVRHLHGGIQAWREAKLPVRLY